MKNPEIIQIIKERFQEQKMNAEYQLQLTKIVKWKMNSPKSLAKKMEGIF